MISKPRRHFVSMALLLGSLTALAVEYQSSEVTVSETVSLELSNLSRTTPKIWDLSIEEWDRYQSLMQGMRGFVSVDNLSPIEVLGIHARTDEERNKYATLWAKLMREDTIRILKFQRAYDEASLKLNQDTPLIDPALLPVALESASSELQTDERIMIFVELDCVVCDLVVDRALDSLDEVEGIDVYFLNLEPTQEHRLQTWANERNIDSNLVRSGRVTINFDDGLLESLEPHQSKVPTLKRRTEDEIQPISVEAIW